MLITFKSKAAADVLMYQEHVKPIFDLLSKSPERGVITPAEIGHVIGQLEAKIVATKADSIVQQETRDILADSGDLPDDKDMIEGNATEFVSFATRSYPLLQMLRAAQKNNVDVVWGI